MRSPWLWAVFLAVAAACGVATLRNFALLFPILDVEVRMTTDGAIAKARQLNASLKLTPATVTRAAAGFRGDPKAQTFIEQEGGGRDALQPLLGEGEHVLYTWRARLFEPGMTHEVSVYFTPAGRPYGFRARVPEAEAGAALEAEQARSIAVERARSDWGVDFTKYNAVSASTVKRTGGRVDHEFRYERVDRSIGEGKLALGLAVSGERLTGVARGILVPEAFERRYSERRSANSTLSSAASVVMTLAYLLGGCLFGAIWLVRRGAWQWKPAAILAFVIALLGAAAVLDSISASWLAYDTAVPERTHVARGIGAAAASLFMWWAVLMATFASGEGLGRLAFGSHPYLWRSWAPRAGATRAILGRTLGGYAWIGFELAFVAAFYYVTHKHFGWWSPGELMIDPNILSHAQPWITPVATAIRAGVWEEFLFRAVPLAGAALIGRHYGREKLFIGIALVVQAVVFGCAHADYPQEPSWARPVELFLPSIVWGLVYLRYGILPGVLMHFGFDLALMSTPLWVTDAPGIGFDRAMVVLFGVAPLLVVLARIAWAGRLAELGAVDVNVTAPRHEPIWRPAARSEATAHRAATPATRGATVLLLALGAIGVAGWAVRAATPPDAPGLSISGEQAVRIAEAAIEKEGAKLGPDWVRMAKAEGPRDQEPHQFVWHRGGAEVFAALLGNHLPPPLWAVRFARFAGDVEVADRAESWFVFIGGDGAVRAVHHRLPEARAGARPTREQAQAMADRQLSQWLGVDPAKLRFVSARSTNRPGRLDWELIYADPSRPVPAGGEAYIGLQFAGEQLAARGRYVFVPEEWTRERKAKRDAAGLVTGVAGLFVFAAFAAIIVLGIRRFARHEVSRRAAIVGGLLMVGYVVAQKALGLEAAMAEGYDTAQPLGQQYVRDALVTLALAITAGLVSAMFVGVGVRFASHDPAARPRLVAWRDAAALAFLMLGAGTWVRMFSPSGGPRMPDVREADSWSPVLSSLLDGADLLVVCGSTVTAVAVLGARSGWKAWLTGLAFALSGLILGAQSFEFTALTLAGTTAAGAVSYWVYRRYVLGRLDVIAPLAVCMALLGNVQYLVRPEFPGAAPGAIAGIAAVLAGYWIWEWLVRKDAA